jgi:hypothetical protein
MRIGSNPFKLEKVNVNSVHQVIVPIFVPNEDGYFKNAFQVTRLCLSSLIRNSSSNTFISVVNNGCCKPVTEYLRELFDKGYIHQLSHFKSNIGQVNAWKSALFSTNAQIVTLSDGDVYFKEDWESSVFQVFSGFPKAAMVSPVPDPRGYRNFTSNVLLDAWHKIKFNSILDSEDLLHFENSLGQAGQHYNHPLRLSHHLTITSNTGKEAIIGNAHFVASFRREAFNYMPKSLAGDALSGDAHYAFVDIPIERAGYWRLGTSKVTAYHIGNVPDKWMVENYDTAGKKELSANLPPLTQSKWKMVPYKMRRRLIYGLVSNALTRPWFFKLWGLPEASDVY